MWKDRFKSMRNELLLQTNSTYFFILLLYIHTDMNESCDLISVKSVQNIHLFSEHQKRFMIFFKRIY